MSPYSACRYISRGRPRVCISTSPAPARATTSPRMGSYPKPLMSFTIEAPAASASPATAALYVSMEMGAANRPLSRAMTGSTLASSSASATGSAPGLVDSPPMSMMSAPSASIRSARSAARSGLVTPPAKESGVTLRMPITSVRGPSSRLSPCASGTVKRGRGAMTAGRRSIPAPVLSHRNGACPPERGRSRSLFARDERAAATGPNVAAAAGRAAASSRRRPPSRPPAPPPEARRPGPRRWPVRPPGAPRATRPGRWP